MKKIPTKTSK